MRTFACVVGGLAFYVPFAVVLHGQHWVILGGLGLVCGIAGGFVGGGFWDRIERRR